jgi:hypothetical protein
MDSYPPEAWRRLGDVLAARRGQLGYGFRRRREFAEANGLKLSARTLQRLEQGERDAYPEETVAIAETIYRLEPGSIAAVLRGGAAAPMAEAREPAPFDPTPQCSFERHIAETPGPPEQVKIEMIKAHRAEGHKAWCAGGHEAAGEDASLASLPA